VTITAIDELQREPRWHRRPDERRAEILHHALLVFGRNGYKRTTLALVAERAGVSAGTVCHYFGSKATLFEQVIAEQLMPLVETEEASLARHRGPSRDLLHELLRRFWERAWQPGILDLMRVVKVESAEFPESGRLLCRQLGDRWRRVFCRILQAGMRSGEFRTLDVDVAARAITYAVIGIAEKVSAFQAYDPRMPDRDVMWQSARDMVDRFVLAKPPRAAKQGEGT
jgi:AcrR family transcriptional regulator